MLKSFVQSAKIEDGHLVFPLLRASLDASILFSLTQAHALGIIYAGKQFATEEGLGDFAKGVVGRVKGIVDGVIDWAKSLFASKVEQLGDDASAEELEQALAETADTVAGAIAATQIQDVIEQTVMEELQATGTQAVSWNVEPDACEICQSNADAGPIPIGQAFPSGHTRPPAHLRCRCHIDQEDR